jgi:hypothetical protein
MAKAVTPGPRQWSMQLPGSVMGNGAATAPWEVTDIVAATGDGYYCQAKLDLRALTSDPKTSRGVSLANISLQEAGPWDITGGETERAIVVYDMLTTVRPSEQGVLEPIFAGFSLPGLTPGFLNPTGTDDSDDNPLNPSQVIWGYWRQMGVDRNIVGGTDMFSIAVGSSYFGEGEVMVGPEVWWTRFIAGVADATQVMTPSANLVCYAGVVPLTEPQEMTQMMRAVQR